MKRSTGQSEPLAKYYTLYFSALRYDGKSPDTLETYQNCLRQFHRYLEQTNDGTPTLANLSIPTVQAYVDALRSKTRWEDNPCIRTSDKPLSDTTINKNVRILRSFASWLEREGYTKQNVLGRLKPPKVTERVRETPTEPDRRGNTASLRRR